MLRLSPLYTLTLRTYANGMPNYRADPDIAGVLDPGLAVPSEVDTAEKQRLLAFLEADAVLERHYQQSTGRPPEDDLRRAALAAMAVYDQ